jgi:glycosyltransferase involved in cell wall biosynthesis
MSSETLTNDERKTHGQIPAVSIIIPAYNVDEYIGAALDSVFAQTWQDFEVIVVNDGSPRTAQLEAALAPYRDRIVYISQENRGVSGARNTGIRAARGEFYAQLDPDDLWEPEYLSTQLETLRNSPGADLVFPNAVIFGEGPEVGRTFLELNRPLNLDYRLGPDLINTAQADRVTHQVIDVPLIRHGAEETGDHIPSDRRLKADGQIMILRSVRHTAGFLFDSKKLPQRINEEAHVKHQGHQAHFG